MVQKVYIKLEFYPISPSEDPPGDEQSIDTKYYGKLGATRKL